ncbi:class II fructose-bisphosphate aldolase [Candidatus Methylomicrobium oryzae]|jgi:fructose-bisphosphate aldolase class II|uniref:class II fructose-bisphosphate aldolase n=1 Tax=Candidatus Methylomicrobium oryzae TaxID=2802053 RepID=UPI00192456B8|nr:class II fructose-bisphosphate aldolase [Methylomicrobium sp. RS1]MBL1265439.1 fructose-bisphosphate aldolase class II [Methylomicrobium sp. RS1]
MALASLRQVLDYAAEHGFAVPAFNVSNMEQVQAIMQAADACDSPVIMQGSAGANRYAGEVFLRHLILAAVEQYPHIPVVMHRDHAPTPAICAQAVQSGFSSVMMDGSLLEDMKTPASFEYNVEVTRTVVNMAHACGVSVEGEIGCLGSLETQGDAANPKSPGHPDHSRLLTDPDEAVEFVRQTQIDALAVAIGTSHGAYKFSKPPTGEVLVISRLKTLQQRLPNTHFVMHGSSSVPQDWLEIINEYGGDIPQTYGVPVAEIVEGIKYGVRKVNIDTDLRMASTGAIRRYVAQPEHAPDLDARKIYQAAREAMQALCQARYEAFGSAGHAGKIKVVPLREMARRYQ